MDLVDGVAKRAHAFADDNALRFQTASPLEDWQKAVLIIGVFWFTVLCICGFSCFCAGLPVALARAAGSCAQRAGVVGQR